MTQHITAIKEHGHGITIYRTLETVPKGANQTIYCILSQIEDWRDRHNGRYPEELFIQVDGGAENANQWVLGMLELLAVKIIVKTVWYTRLPTGHTHEDIDGVFGVLWKAMRNQAILTLDEYVEKVKETFKAKNYKMEVKTLMAIPDYKVLINQAIDPKLSNLHHTLQTQHQWRFEVIFSYFYHLLIVYNFETISETRLSSQHHFSHTDAKPHTKHILAMKFTNYISKILPYVRHQ